MFDEQGRAHSIHLPGAQERGAVQFIQPLLRAPAVDVQRPRGIQHQVQRTKGREVLGTGFRSGLVFWRPAVGCFGVTGRPPAHIAGRPAASPSKPDRWRHWRHEHRRRCNRVQVNTSCDHDAVTRETLRSTGGLVCVLAGELLHLEGAPFGTLDAARKLQCSGPPGACPTPIGLWPP